MFGISGFLAAVKRLTASINKSADLFDAANVELERNLKVESHPEEKAKVEANGHARRRLPVEK